MWQETVISQNTRASRKEIVLGAANQDGGAHVDSNSNAKIRELKEGVRTFTLRRDGVVVSEQKLTDHHFPMLRQIGYEVLNSPDLATIKT